MYKLDPLSSSHSIMWAELFQPFDCDYNKKTRIKMNFKDCVADRVSPDCGNQEKRKLKWFQ